MRQAEATFGQATQDLIVRVAQAYFDVLAAQDTLALVRAQKAAIAEQLAQAKRNFEVGTATITDTHEAQARYDLIVRAGDRGAERPREPAPRAAADHRQGVRASSSRCAPTSSSPPPNPNDMETWVELAEQAELPGADRSEAAAEVAALEAKRNRAAHLPTLDVVATHGQTGAERRRSDSSVGRDTTQTVIGLQLAMPLYPGRRRSTRASARPRRSR